MNYSHWWETALRGNIQGILKKELSVIKYRQFTYPSSKSESEVRFNILNEKHLSLLF